MILATATHATSLVSVDARLRVLASAGTGGGVACSVGSAAICNAWNGRTPATSHVDRFLLSSGMCHSQFGSE